MNHERAPKRNGRRPQIAYEQIPYCIEAPSDEYDRHDRKRKYTVMKVVLPLIFIFSCLYVVLYDYVDIRHDSIAGWSSDTSRDTKTYVLPDNVTLLNQPKSICEIDKSTSEKSNSKNTLEDEESSQIFLLVIICSKMENFPARTAIRETWGNQQNYERLSKTFQIIHKHYQNVNVTDKMLTDFEEFSNYTSMDRRYRRDINENAISNLTNAEEMLDDVDGLSKHIKFVKREIDNSNSANEDDDELSDDPRFDHGSIITTPQIDLDEDDNILGNFEEVQTNKQYDYDDYASEPSNIMRIPPRGEKYNIDETVLKSAVDSQNIVKLSFDNDKLKLQYQPTIATDKIVKSDKGLKQDGDNLSLNINESFEKFQLDPPVRTRFLFLLGQSSNENNTELQSKIDDEASIYDDIIQEGFIDSYNNLTLKSMMLLKWVVSNCGKNVHYIMKTDDDMYINIPRLIEALLNKTKEFIVNSISKKDDKPSELEAKYKNIPNSLKNSILKDEKLLMGDLICEARPISDTHSKWYSPKYMYPGAVYPHYLSGTGYVMSFATAKALYQAALNTPLFHLEDIFITGMCSKQADIKPIDHPGFSYSTRKFDACTFAYLISAHQMSPIQIHRMHNMLTKSPSRMLEMCEVKRLLTTKSTSLAKTLLAKLSVPILGSPRSFIMGLKSLGQANRKSTFKKRRRLNNGCF